MKLLKRLTEADAPSGRESAIRDIIKEEAERLGYEVSEDTLGSIIAHRPGSGKKLMIDAHMDEIGVIAAYTDDNGFIRFGAVGGLYVKELQHRRVRFANGTIGVIGSEEKAFNEKPELSKLYIDIGAKNKAAAEKLVNTGDTAVFDGGFYQRGDTVISKALDNRAGCYVLLKAMEEIKESENDLYFVFSTQEEVGLRGARTAAFGIMPDYAIAVDVTDTGDTPSCPVMDVKLGEGAAIKIMDNSVMCDVHVVAALRKLAAANKIPYQSEIMADGGTDAGAIALTGGGVRAGGISIPTRYIHSPSEMASKKDINACIELVKAACSYNWQ
ncbi:MAG: M42 family metallopeptidase [Candidatus Ornithomonoglobus sp.]